MVASSPRPQARRDSGLQVTAELLRVAGATEGPWPAHSLHLSAFREEMMGTDRNTTRRRDKWVRVPFMPLLKGHLFIEVTEIDLGKGGPLSP